MTLRNVNDYSCIFVQNQDSGTHLKQAKYILIEIVKKTHK